MDWPERIASSTRRQLGRPPLGPLALDGYRRERVRDLTIPVAGALIEAGFIGVIADKLYDVHPALLAVVTAAPMFGNLSSFAWARLAEGRRKVPFLTGLQTALVVLVAAVALLPDGPVGGALLVTDMVLMRLLVGGIITVRSLVWTLNYPSQARGRVTARLSIFTTFTLTVTSLLGSLFLDARPESFRWIYAAGAVIASLGVVAFSGVRVVGEASQLSLERGRPGAAPDAPLPRPETADAPESTVPPPRLLEGQGIVALLRSDPLYARYLAWQFLLGVSNMMVEAPLILLVSRDLGASYTVSIALTLGLPLGLAMLTLPGWAAYIDRVHIAEFRSVHSWLWVGSQLLTWVGAAQGSLLWVGIGRAVLGIGRGGGQLAWLIGHNDFASPERATHYMGVHVTLTGLRGAFAPFLGMLLYVGWSARELPALGWQLPRFEGLGGRVMLLAAGLSTVATLGFGALHRRMAQRGATAADREPGQG